MELLNNVRSIMLYRRLLDFNTITIKIFDFIVYGTAEISISNSK